MLSSTEIQKVWLKATWENFLPFKGVWLNDISRIKVRSRYLKFQVLCLPMPYYYVFHTKSVFIFWFVSFCIFLFKENGIFFFRFFVFYVSLRYVVRVEIYLWVGIENTETQSIYCEVACKTIKRNLICNKDLIWRV